MSLAGIQLRERGWLITSAKHRDELKVAKLLAQFLAGLRGVISADDVFEYMAPEALGAAAGCIFIGSEWEPVGFKQSTRACRRCGTQRTWRLR